MVVGLCSNLNAQGFTLKVHKVKDADTINADIELPWGVTLRKKDIRLLGVDTWEASKRRKTVVITDEEIKKGKEGKLALQKLVDESSRTFLMPGSPKEEFDPYGRILGYMYVTPPGKTSIGVHHWMQEHGFQRK